MGSLLVVLAWTLEWRRDSTMASWKLWILSLCGPMASSERLAARTSRELAPTFCDSRSSVLESIRA